MVLIYWTFSMIFSLREEPVSITKRNLHRQVLDQVFKKRESKK